MQALNSLNDIDPYVRWAKIDQNIFLTGNWIDYDNVFTMVASGNATFILNGESYEAQKDDIVLIPPGVRHLITSDRRKSFLEYIFHFDLYRRNAGSSPVARGRILDAVRRAIPEEEELLKDLPLVIRPDESTSGEIRRLFLALHREFFEDRFCAQGILQAYAKLILILAYRCIMRQDTIVRENSVYSWTSIQRVVEIIQTKYNNPNLTIKVIADSVGFSPNYVSTLVKNNLGITIHEYMTFVRIEAAKQLLYESSKNISQIAECTGYSSVYAFSRSFKRATGMSPTAYAHQASVRFDIHGSMETQ